MATANSQRHDDIDNYNVGDLSDDPFRSPSPPPTSKKRKEGDDVEIDEAVSVQKRARVPNVKLDEDRLLGPAGIPKLRSRAQKLKIKGKGHEFSDASRLLSFYQLWLDDLFPKAKFLDALAMVEKAGHKKKLMTARNGWINEGAPKDKLMDDVEVEALGTAQTPDDALGSTTNSGRPTTPTGNTSNPNEDLYEATPRRSRPIVSINRSADVPDDDDLQALIAEAESQDAADPKPQRQRAGSPDDDDDLAALIAEAENHDDGGANKIRTKTPEKTADDFDDDEAAMREMEGMW